MAIKTKVGLILVVVFSVLSLTEVIIQYFFILPSFQILENKNAVKDARRVVQAIENEISHIDKLCFDWAAWDDTYSFIQSPVSDYLEANLTFETFQANNLNLIYFYDISGKLMWGKIYDLETEKEIFLDRFSLDKNLKADPLFDFDRSQNDLISVFKRGVIKTEKGVMLISSRPIITTENKGPIRGAVMMGRLLDRGMVQRLSSQTEVNFKVRPVSVSADTGKVQKMEVEKGIRTLAGFAIEDNDEQFFSVYTTKTDITGKPALLINASVPRDIMKEVRHTVRYAMHSAAVASIITLIAVALALQRIVLRPLKKLRDHTQLVTEARDFTKAVQLERADEIGEVAVSFNLMMRNVHENEQTQKLMLEEKENLITVLKEALTKIKTLEGFIPICSSCKKIRDDKGYWNQIESYIEQHSEALFSHSICPECSEKMYGNEDWYIRQKKKKQDK